MKLEFRKILWALGAALGVLGLVYLLRPMPVDVDLGSVTQGPLVVTVDREGKTRVKERYAVAAPLAGRLRRIELHPGDEVREGQTVLAVIEPVSPALLDARTLAEAQARAAAADEAIRRAEEHLLHARKDLARAETLRSNNVASPEDLEHAQHQERIAQYEQKIAVFERDMARAALQRVQPAESSSDAEGAFELRAPINGVVLGVWQESSRVIPGGAEILTLGDKGALECVVDVLSKDAVRIRPGAKAYLEQWGGDLPLVGHVRRIEPGGFTKISALGVEEQRVNVIIELDDPPQQWATLGDNYRVEARIVLWEGEQVLQVPAGALFRHHGEWAVYRAAGGRAHRVAVKLGHHNGREAEVVEGLRTGDAVVLYPSDRVRDGVRIVVRTDG